MVEGISISSGQKWKFPVPSASECPELVEQLHWYLHILLASTQVPDGHFVLLTIYKALIIPNESGKDISMPFQPLLLTILLQVSKYDYLK